MKSKAHAANFVEASNNFPTVHVTKLENTVCEVSGCLQEYFFFDSLTYIVYMYTCMLVYA